MSLGGPFQFVHSTLKRLLIEGMLPGRVAIFPPGCPEAAEKSGSGNLGGPGKRKA